MQVESEDESYSILLQNAETVGLVSPLHGKYSRRSIFLFLFFLSLNTPPCISAGEEHQRTAIPVSSLKVGDEVLLLLHGGARHTGIEIKEFIVEK